MGDYNPFANRKKTEYELVPTGYYQGTLLEVNTKKGKNKEGEEVDKIQFVFGIEANGKPARVFKTVYPGIKSTSQFAMTVRSIAPESFSDDLLTDDNAIWAYTKSLVGRSVQFYVGTDPTGKWNNIDAIAPVMAAKAPQAPKAAAPRVQEQTTLPVQTEDDDIPF